MILLRKLWRWIASADYRNEIGDRLLYRSLLFRASIKPTDPLVEARRDRARALLRQGLTPDRRN